MGMQSNGTIENEDTSILVSVCTYYKCVVSSKSLLPCPSCGTDNCPSTGLVAWLLGR